MTPAPHSLPKLSLLLLSLLLTPTVSLAATQEPAPEEEASSTDAEEEEQEEEESQSSAEEDESPRLLDEPTERYHPGWSRRSPWGLRVGAEVGLGLLTGSLGIIPGAFVGALGCLTIVACVAGIVVGAELGFSVAAIAGVYAAGTALGGDGKILPVVLGTLGGLVGTIVLLTSYIVPFDVVPIVAAATLPPVIGAMVGYELSVSPEPAAPAVALGRTRLQPLLSVSPRGTFVGLGGHF